jgi:SlyX protein
MSESRFEVIETKLAFQEELIQQLDDALIAQQKQISALQLQLRVLQSEFISLETHAPDTSEPPPPHY